MIGVNGALRVLGVNNIDIEAPLKGFLLLIRNQDVPGVIGRVGTLLGQHQINIANFALGRLHDSTEAMGIVNVDHEVPAEVLAELRGDSGQQDERRTGGGDSTRLEISVEIEFTNRTHMPKSRKDAAPEKLARF